MPKTRVKGTAPTRSNSDLRADKPNTLQVRRQDGESDSKAHSRMMASPTVNAATTMFQFHPMKDGANITDLVDELGKQVLTVREGNMDRPEAILTAQAHALDTIFTAMAQRAAMNLKAGYLQAMETYLRLALKAQSQSRSTLETLSEIKNPRGPTFIRQQNVAHQQQVNNAASSAETPLAPEKDITPANELLETSHGERLDGGTPGKASATDKGLETLGKLDRPKD